MQKLLGRYYTSAIFLVLMNETSLIQILLFITANYIVFDFWKFAVEATHLAFLYMRLLSCASCGAWLADDMCKLMGYITLKAEARVLLLRCGTFHTFLLEGNLLYIELIVFV